MTNADLQKLIDYAGTLHGKIDGTNALLKAIFYELRRRPQPFALPVVNNNFVSPHEARGVVRYVHNPTSVPVTVTLFDGSNQNGASIYSNTLAPGESDPVFAVFRTGLYSSTGAGAQVHGEFDA